MNAPAAAPVKALAELVPGEEADFYALLASKDTLTTRDGKPYFRVTFRDARRQVSFPIWADAPLAAACRDEWQVGEFYKLRAAYRETNFGPQLDIRKIRPVSAQDYGAGFEPRLCVAHSRFDAEEMFAELQQIVIDDVRDPQVRELTLGILQEHRPALLTLAAASHNHHAYAAGFLQHVLSVTKTCRYFADKYADLYPHLDPPLDRDLVIVGGVLHDIGKLRELEMRPAGAVYTPAGHLVGHILQGRDILREAAQRHPIDPDKLLRLEHVIVAHQRLPEWGSPKPPMTPEALLVHFADDVDAKIEMMVDILRDESGGEPMTSSRNALGHRLYVGRRAPAPDAGAPNAAAPPSSAAPESTDSGGRLF
jgi:3'-5' exoribonuclease